MAPNNYPQVSCRNKLPKKVSRANFNKYIDSCLSRNRHGPPTKLSRYQIFNYILYVLHTGIQWKELRTKRNEVHWSNIYRWHNKWSKDGSYQNLFETSIMFLKDNNKLDVSIIHGDGSNTVAKKGVKALDTLGINIRKE